MKKYLRPMLAALVLALLVGGAYAASAGDSLISLKYLQDHFFPKAVQAGEEAAGKALQETYDKAKSQLDAVHSGAGSAGGTGGLSSDTLARRLWSDGQILTLPTGSGFVLLDGSATVVHTGVVVDITDGTEAASGGKLTPNHRYLVAEDTDAAVTIRSGQAALGLQGSYSLTAGKAQHTPFFDVSQSDWFYSPVNYAYEEGLFSGVDENHFSPALAMNRAMLMSVLHRLAGSPAVSGSVTLTDVPKNSWYAQAVYWGYAQGITSGTGNNTFSPLLQVTREQAVAMLYNYAKYLNKSGGAGADLSAYSDLNRLSQWARPAMSWAVGQGIIGGASNGGKLTLDPQRGASRAEMAVMLRAFCEKIL